MIFLYSIGIKCYYFLVFIIQLFNPKAKSFIQGRKNQWKKIRKFSISENVVWLHCASLGEFDQAIPLMNIIKQQKDKKTIVVTFYSPSGMEHYHKRNHCADYVYYLPIDTQKNAAKFIEQIKPQQIFFIKYEFWLNYIFEAKKKNIPLYSVSCILRQNQIYFKNYGTLFRNALQSFSFFFVQNDETKKLLNSIQINNVQVTGDTRFDKVIENKKNVQKDPLIELFLKNSKTSIILGSSWPIEESIFSMVLPNLPSDFKIIIAPHDVSEKHLLQIESIFNKKTIRYSQLNEYLDKQILIIDCIGKLSNAYFYGNYAIIGGGFTGKLHNTLEPVVFGIPVLFGPKHSKFPEAEYFIENEVGFEFNNSGTLLNLILSLESQLSRIQEKCDFLIYQSAGSAKKIANFIYN